MHNCGLDRNAEIVCFGSNSFGESNPPEGPFESVVAGAGYTCAIDPQKVVRCWGNLVR
jgi:hypothetical protein